MSKIGSSLMSSISKRFMNDSKWGGSSWGVWFWGVYCSGGWGVGSWGASSWGVCWVRSWGASSWGVCWVRSWGGERGGKLSFGLYDPLGQLLAFHPWGDHLSLQQLEAGWEALCLRPTADTVLPCVLFLLLWRVNNAGPVFFLHANSNM